MKLGFAPLWSAWMEHSNDVHFAASWILTPNHEKPWIVAFGRVQSKFFSVIHCRICGVWCGFSAAVLKGTIVNFFEHRPNLNLGINCHLGRQWVRFVTVVDVERKSHSLGRPHHMTVTYHMTDTPTPLYDYLCGHSLSHHRAPVQPFPIHQQPKFEVCAFRGSWYIKRL